MEYCTIHLQITQIKQHFHSMCLREQICHFLEKLVQSVIKMEAAFGSFFDHDQLLAKLKFRKCNYGWNTITNAVVFTCIWTFLNNLLDSVRWDLCTSQSIYPILRSVEATSRRLSFMNVFGKCVYIIASVHVVLLD